MATNVQIEVHHIKYIISEANEVSSGEKDPQASPRTQCSTNGQKGNE